MEDIRPLDLPPPPPPPPTASTSPGEGRGPILRLPIVEAAQRDLEQRQVLPREDFDRLSEVARRSAFTVARVQSLDALERIRIALAADVNQGGTLREFRDQVEQVLGESLLTPAHIETVYRTNVGAAYTQGLMEVLQHPLVSDEFPYLEYTATHDSRTREEHLAMETLGIDGTAVYRRDDPVMRRFLPPWDYNCRCAVVPLSIEDAARRGVNEAREWLQTGIPPARPAWVQHPPFDPPANFAGPSGWVEGMVG